MVTLIYCGTNMNERIRELMIEAGIYECDDFEPHPTFEKFAELIVRECVAICEDTDGEHIADARWGRRCCALEIREHFGVEE
jgi:hypothetical protein